MPLLTPFFTKHDRYEHNTKHSAFKIYPGKLEEFKRLAAQCMQLAGEKDKGTLRYEFFFNDNQTECIVYEEYVDSDASIQHFNNIGNIADAIFLTGDVSGEMWGNPSPELRKAVEDKGVRVFEPFLSLNKQHEK